MLNRQVYIIALLLLCLTTRAAVADDVGQNLSGDSRASQTEWNEFYHSSTDLFQQGKGYKISFSYQVLARADNANFYMLVRDQSSPGRTFGWQEWDGKPGDSGTVQSTFICRDAHPYYLIIGIQNQGQIQVGDIKVASSPILKPLDVPVPSPVRTWISPGHTTYYIDSLHGSDTADGLSAKSAKRSLSVVNSGTFGPGDKIMLCRGSSWNGFLAPGGSGTDGKPIVISTYGKGASPRIDAQGKFLSTLFLNNESYVTVNGLDIANHGTVPQPKLTGVKLEEDNFGITHDVVLDGLYVHDVTGSDAKDEGGGAGIDCVCSGDKVPTKFDGLLIEHCHLVRTDRNGITTEGSWERLHWFPSLNVVIRDNLLEDIGGDGIVPIACDHALVEHNILRGARMRAQDYCAGIWPWSCDNTVVQYNEVSGMKGTNDGEGYDSDFNCRNSLFQYNFSHNNDGGFMLICDNGTQGMPYNIGNSGTIIRYNISINDGLHTLHIAGPCSNTHIYNNTIYIGQGGATELVTSDSWGGLQTGTVFTNNIFETSQKVGFSSSGDQTFLFDDNVFFGDFENVPEGLKAILSNPKLKKPGSLIPSDYRPTTGSPCLGAGEAIADNGGSDFLGNIVPPSGPVTIGALRR